MINDICNLEVIGEGMTTKVYRDGSIVIKLYTNASLADINNEAKHQQFAYNAGLPVPAIHGVRELGNNAIALDMDYVNGIPLLHPQMDKHERRNAIDSLVKLQCKVHKIPVSGLPRQSERLEHMIKHTQHFCESEKEKLLSLLAELADDSNYLCHGDFHPLNILYDGNKHWIIDWVDATAGNPLADACRTYLIFQQYIQRMAGIYLKAFCKEAGAKSDDILAWQPIVAAARLNENLDDHARAWLLSLVKEHI